MELSFWVAAKGKRRETVTFLYCEGTVLWTSLGGD